MRPHFQLLEESASILWLRWALALVLGGQALVFLIHLLTHGSSAAAPHHAGPAAVFIGIAGAELAGSVLLLMTTTRAAGAVLVLASLTGATAWSLYTGTRPPPAFGVYVIGLLVVLQHRSPPRAAGLR